MFSPARHLAANMALSFTSCTPVTDHKHHVVTCIADMCNVLHTSGMACGLIATSCFSLISPSFYLGYLWERSVIIQLHRSSRYI